jgi:hypothetical protein
LHRLLSSKDGNVVYTKLTATNAVLAVTGVVSATEQNVMTIAVTFSAVRIQDFLVAEDGSSSPSTEVSWNLTTSTGAPSTTTPFDFTYKEEPGVGALEVASYALAGTTTPVLSLSVDNVDSSIGQENSTLLNYFLAAAQGATFPSGALDVYRTVTGTTPALVGNYAFTNTQVQSFAIQGSAVSLTLTPASYGYTAAP